MQEAQYMIENVDKWMQPKKVSVPLPFQPASAEVQRYGANNRQYSIFNNAD